MSLALAFAENVELQWRSCANANSTTTNYDVGSTILVDLKAIYLKSAMKVTTLGHGLSWSTIQPIQVSMLDLCTHFFFISLDFHYFIYPKQYGTLHTCILSIYTNLTIFLYICYFAWVQSTFDFYKELQLQPKYIKKLLWPKR